MKRHESIAFVGAGPLPLSAFLLLHRLQVPVTCLDKDQEACIQAQRLVDVLGLQHQVTIRAIDGAAHDYRSHPLVFIASLVPDKHQVVSQIQKTRPDAVAAMRSADGVCRLLYDPVDEQGMAALGCTLLGRTTATPEIINSTLLYRV